MIPIMEKNKSLMLKIDILIKKVLRYKISYKLSLQDRVLIKLKTIYIKQIINKRHDNSIYQRYPIHKYILSIFVIPFILTRIIYKYNTVVIEE